MSGLVQQRTHLEMGNGVTTDYTYNAKTRRLATLQSQAAGAPTKLQDNVYDYDRVGNITELHNNAQVPPRNDMGGPTNQTFHYDSLYRLVSADGDYTAAHEKHTYTLGMSYDAIHNITHKTQTHTVIRNGGKALVQRKTTYDWVYRYAASGDTSRQPHAPIHIGTPDANGTPVGRSFTYDANGNQEGWTNDSNGTRRAIVWDEENHIQEVQDPQHTESYTYNDQGVRMVRRSKYGETAYVNQFFTVRNGAITTTHIYAGTTRLASKVRAGTPISGTSSSTSTTTTTVFTTSASSTQPGNGNGKGPTANANAQDHQNNSNGNKGGARLNGNPGQGRDKRSDTANEHAQDVYKNPTLTGELPNNNKGNNGHNGKGNGHGAGNGGGNGSSGGNGGHTGNGNGYGSNKTNTGSGREFLYYYHPDHLGSSTYVTDANAKRYEHIEYFPFGETWVEESSNTWRTPYLFTSKEMDPQTKLYYYGARYYDPRTSVWQSADPILGQYLEGAPNSGVYSPHNLALYTYVGANPVRLIDPNGQFDAEHGTIEKNDTLTKIAKQLNTKWHTNMSVGEYAKRNHIKNPNLIYPGQHINVDPYQPVPFIDDKGNSVQNNLGKQMMKPAGLDPHTFVNLGRGIRRAAGGMGVLSVLYKFKQGGPWDTQRRYPHGPRIPRSIPELVDMATVNIGLYGAASGMDIRALLGIQDWYAKGHSNFGSAKPDPTYHNLAHRNVFNTELGYDLYNSGRIGPSQ